jgi:hypothetical protein
MISHLDFLAIAEKLAWSIKMQLFALTLFDNLSLEE